MSRLEQETAAANLAEEDASDDESWLERLGDSVGAIILGAVLIVAAGATLYWSESRAVAAARGIDEGSAVRTISADRIDPRNDGRLIYVVGMLSAGGPASDPEFGMKSEGVRLRRIVEMFQWSEEASSGAANGEKTYEYVRRWLDRPVDSDDFHEWRGHDNPMMPYRTHLALAPHPRLGPFIVPPNLLYRFGTEVPLAAGSEQAAQLRKQLGRPVTVVDGVLYVGAGPAHPEVGDLRITFRYVPFQKASVVAEQAGQTFDVYHPRVGGPIEAMVAGEVPASSLFDLPPETPSSWPWIIRVGCCLVTFIGFVLVIGPITSLCDLLPILRAVVEAGVVAVGLFFTVTLVPLIVAAAWVMYRPLVAGSALAVGLALACGALGLAHWHKGRKDAVTA